MREWLLLEKVMNKDGCDHGSDDELEGAAMNRGCDVLDDQRWRTQQLVDAAIITGAEEINGDEARDVRKSVDNGSKDKT